MFYLVPRYEFAEVRRDGKVRSSLTKHIYKPYRDKDGYLRCKIWDGEKLKGIYIHRAVALVFVPNPHDKPIVNHKNSVRDDNRPEKLEWVTHKENSEHGVQAGNFPKGQEAFAATYTDKEIKKVCELLGKNWSSPRVSKATGVPVSTIDNVRTRKGWTHLSKNYVFKEYKPKITDETAKEITLLLSDGCSVREVIEKIGHRRVNADTVRNIRKGKTFKHLTRNVQRSSKPRN